LVLTENVRSSRSYPEHLRGSREYRAIAGCCRRRSQHLCVSPARSVKL